MKNATNGECRLTPKRRDNLKRICTALRRENTMLRRRLDEVTGKAVYAKPGPQMQDAIDYANREIGEHFGMAELCSQLRFARYVEFRQHVAFRLRTVYGWSYPRIGNAFGGRDHATIMHAIAKHQERANAHEYAHEGEEALA